MDTPGLVAHQLVVLDIESRVDPAVCGVAAHGRNVAACELRRRAALHTVTAAAMLIADVAFDGSFGSVTLMSQAADDQGELDVLLWIDRQLESRPGGRILVTYGGRLHDLPLIRRRAIAHWLFDSRAIHNTISLAHVDLMTDGLPEAARWTSLRDECAALGIPLREQSVDARTDTPRMLRKCQVDVVATFLLHLHRASFATGGPELVAHGWIALAAHLGDDWEGAAHLRPYRMHPRLDAARRWVHERDASSNGAIAVRS